MPTKVKAHPRKGTRGVKAHVRRVNGKATSNSCGPGKSRCGTNPRTGESVYCIAHAPWESHYDTPNEAAEAIAQGGKKDAVGKAEKNDAFFGAIEEAMRFADDARAHGYDIEIIPGEVSYNGKTRFRVTTKEMVGKNAVDAKLPQSPNEAAEAMGVSPCRPK